MKKIFGLIIAVGLSVSLLQLPTMASEVTNADVHQDVKNISQSTSARPSDAAHYTPRTRWSTVALITSGVTSDSSGRIYGYSDITSYESYTIKVTCTLQRKSGSSWVNVTSATSSGSYSHGVETSTTTTRGVYRVTTDASTYQNGKLIESGITSTSYEYTF